MGRSNRFHRRFEPADAVATAAAVATRFAREFIAWSAAGTTEELAAVCPPLTFCIVARGEQRTNDDVLVTFGGRNEN